MKGIGRKLPSADVMAVNIANVYSLAIADDIAKGSQWYPLAHDIVVEWADTFDRSIANVACIVAAMSPQNLWSYNLIQADDILHGRPLSVGGLLACERKARAIADDHATDTIGYFPQGYKVRSFACNLAGDSNIVTVDTHALQVAMGDVRSTVTMRSWEQYAHVASAYTRAATVAGIAPATLQAITWVAWKRIYSPERKRALRSKTQKDGRAYKRMG